MDAEWKSHSFASRFARLLFTLLLVATQNSKRAAESWRLVLMLGLQVLSQYIAIVCICLLVADSGIKICLPWSCAVVCFVSFQSLSVIMEL
jgi:hypothetical protein